MIDKEIPQGGYFLVDSGPPCEVFTPEEFREEHRMLINVTDSFVKNEVQPRITDPLLNDGGSH
jgi:hypothetical protein